MTTPFVGRARELELLAADLAAVRSGTGRFTLIIGEPGIGKTRLADRVASIAAGQDFDVHWGRCWQGGGAPVFWPWLQLLRSCRERRLPPDDAGDVAWATARVDTLLHQGETREDAGAALDVDQARFRLFDAVASFLHAHAGSRPLVLVLDDLHDADDASLLLLHFLARDLRRSPILILGTCREAEIRRSAALTTAFAALARESHSHLLRGFARHELEEFLDIVSDATFDSGLRDDVCRITEGNPFFVDEVTKALLARPTATARTRMEIPFTVKEFIRQRLEPLGEPARRLLEAAAVLGRDFDSRLLARAVSQPIEECRALLEHVTREGLVEPADSQGRAWRFVHMLIRETLREDQKPPAARELHLRIASLLSEDRHRGLPVRMAGVAYHLVEALPLPDPSIVLATLLESAREAMSTLAFEEAARDFARAIDLLEQGSTTSAPTASNADALAAIMVEHGQALRFGGQLGKARETFCQAASLLRQYCDGSGTDAVIRDCFARAVLGFGKVSETGAIDDDLVALLQEALAMFAGVDTALHASLLARLAMALYFVPGSTECVVLGQRAVTMAERTGDARAHADALVAQHFVLWRPGTAPERLRVAESLIGLCGRVNEKEAALEARLWRIADLIELGQVPRARIEHESYDADAEAARLPVHRWHAAMLRSTFAFLEARSHDAQREADNALAIGASAELPNARAFHLAQVLQLRTAERRMPLLQAPLRRTADALPLMPIWTVCAAEAALAAGSEADARRDYERFAADRFASVPRDGLWLATIAVLSRLAVGLGDREGGACLRELLLPFRDAWVVSVTAISVPGPVRFFLGLLCELTGDREAAIGHLEAAAELGRVVRCRSVVDECERELSRLVATAELGVLWARALSPGEAVFHRGTDFWTLAAGGHALRLRDSKGLRYLHYLIENPEKDFHVFDLVAAVEGSLPSASNAFDEELRPGREGDTGPVVDAAALSAYRNRLREIDSDLAAAEAFHDTGRVDLLKSEREFVTREISAAMGLGGRRRGTGSPSEQVRVRVTKVIGLAMRRIAEANPLLGRVLAREIRTGTFCTYRPDPDRPIRWITRGE